MFQKIFFLAVTITTAMVASGSTAYAAGTQTITATDNTIATMSPDGITNNRAAFQQLLDSAAAYDHTTINIPAGNYAFTGRVLLRSNVTINFADGAKFISHNNTNFSYFSTEPGYDSGVQNVTWNNPYFSSAPDTNDGHFSSSMVHAKNITYNHPTWYRALGAGNHLLDIMGSSYITVNAPKVIGVTEAQKNSQANWFKEAIQVSYATRGSLGSNALDATPQVFDSLPSHHIVVKDGSFTPSYDDNGNITSLAPVPIGEHADVSNQQIHDIAFTNNYILDPLPASTNRNEILGVIHFLSTKNLTISNNTFEYKTAPANSYIISVESYAKLPNMLPLENITITGNTFKNVKPTKAYVLAQVLPGPYGTTPINTLTISGNTVWVTGNHPEFIETINTAHIIGLTVSGNQFNPQQNKLNQPGTGAQRPVTAPNTGAAPLGKPNPTLAIASLGLICIASTLYVITKRR